jgi:hypothetical protein
MVMFLSAKISTDKDKSVDIMSERIVQRERVEQVFVKKKARRDSVFD